MADSIFDIIDRIYKGPAAYTEPHFAYMNRSARESIGKCRLKIEEWFSNFPEECKADVRSRLRSPNSNQFLSAFFELYIHAILHFLGYKITCHPIIKSGEKHPDFFACNEAGEEFYFEAVLASNISDEKAAEAARMNAVYESLDKLSSPNFFIGMHINGAPATPPPTRQLRAQVANWLNSLNADEIALHINEKGVEDLPKLEFQHENWRIEFFPIPKDPEYRVKEDSRPIGIITPSPQWIDNRSVIKQALSKKAGKYGELDKPFIIAVNMLSMAADEIDITEALFGSEKFVININEKNPAVADSYRQQNGLWIGPKGIQNSRVSAILACHEIFPWSIHKKNVCLYHNPWAKYAYGGALIRMTRAAPNDSGFLDHHQGIHPREILGIPEDWIFQDCE